MIIKKWIRFLNQYKKRVSIELTFDKKIIIETISNKQKLEKSI